MDCRSAACCGTLMAMDDPSISTEAMISIEVAVALPQRQWLIPLQVTQGTTVAEALARLDLAQYCPGFELDLSRIGIFGKRCSPQHALQAGDRIELYRPLHADPKTIRRELAKLEARRKR